MQRVSKYWPWVFLSAFWALAAGAAGAAPFRVTLETDAIKASGVTPGGQVILLGVTREIGEDDFPTVRRHLEARVDEDGDGTVRFPLEGGVPVRSVWAAADLASGDFDAAAPESFGLRRANWRGRGLERRQDGKDAVEDRRPLVELLVVRPQTGAWALRVGDGGESDADGVIDGRLQGVLDQMTPLAGSPKPPSTFEKGDLVVALDPSALEITLIKVPSGLEEK